MFLRVKTKPGSSRKSGQLVDLAIKTRREKAKKGPPVVIEETWEEHRVATGFHEAYGAVHRQLGFDELLPTKRNRTARETPRHIATAKSDRVRRATPAEKQSCKAGWPNFW